MPQRKRGRPRKVDPMADFFAKYSEELKLQKESDPERYERGAEMTRSMVETLDRAWLKMRQNGVTLEYLKMLDITDPELMEPDKILTWEQAQQKYPNAIPSIDAAKRRQHAARAKGASSTRSLPERLAQHIAVKYPRLVHDYLTKARRPSQVARNILDHANHEEDPWPKWIVTRSRPSERTICNALRLLEKANRSKK